MQTVAAKSKAYFVKFCIERGFLEALHRQWHSLLIHFIMPDGYSMHSSPGRPCFLRCLPPGILSEILVTGGLSLLRPKCTEPIGGSCTMRLLREATSLGIIDSSAAPHCACIHACLMSHSPGTAERCFVSPVLKCCLTSHLGLQMLALHALLRASHQSTWTFVSILIHAFVSQVGVQQIRCSCSVQPAAQSTITTIASQGFLRRLLM